MWITHISLFPHKRVCLNKPGFFFFMFAVVDYQVKLMSLFWNLFRVPETAPLYDILNEFQKGHSHMAVVVKYNKEKTESLLQQSRSRQLKSLRNLTLDTAPLRCKDIFKLITWTLCILFPRLVIVT